MNADERVDMKCVCYTTVCIIFHTHTHMSNPICNSFCETEELNSINGFWEIDCACALCVIGVQLKVTRSHLKWFFQAKVSRNK